MYEKSCAAGCWRVIENYFSGEILCCLLIVDCFLMCYFYSCGADIFALAIIEMQSRKLQSNVLGYKSIYSAFEFLNSWKQQPLFAVCRTRGRVTGCRTLIEKVICIVALHRAYPVDDALRLKLPCRQSINWMLLFIDWCCTKSKHFN